MPNNPSSLVMKVTKDHCKLAKSISALFSHITTITKITRESKKHKVIKRYRPEFEKNIIYFFNFY